MARYEVAVQDIKCMPLNQISTSNKVDLRLTRMPIYTIHLHLLDTYSPVRVLMPINISLNRRLAPNVLKSFLLILLSYPLSLPPHTLHIPISIILRPALLLTLLLFLTILPPAVFEHSSTRRLLRLSRLVLRSLLIQPLLLPFRKRLRRDGRERTSEFEPFRFQEILKSECFQRRLIHQRFLSRALLFRFEDEAGGKAVLVHAFVAAVGTGPEPAVLALFDCVDEVFAYFVCGGFGVAVLA